MYLKQSAHSTLSMHEQYCIDKYNMGFRNLFKFFLLMVVCLPCTYNILVNTQTQVRTETHTQVCTHMHMMTHICTHCFWPIKALSRAWIYVIQEVTNFEIFNTIYFKIGIWSIVRTSTAYLILFRQRIMELWMSQFIHCPSCQYIHSWCLHVPHPLCHTTHYTLMNADLVQC